MRWIISSADAWFVLQKMLRQKVISDILFAQQVWRLIGNDFLFMQGKQAEPWSRKERGTGLWKIY
jgi:hypothetical protein